MRNELFGIIYRRHAEGAGGEWLHCAFNNNYDSKMFISFIEMVCVLFFTTLYVYERKDVRRLHCLRELNVVIYIYI